MARVTYGESITEYAGSIGGVTFQKNPSGNIAKLRSNPIVNPTPLQATYQTNMAKLVAYWPTLSQENKGAWDTFAGLHDHTTPWGETKTLSGYQWFISVNLIRLVIDLYILVAPPVWEVMAPSLSFDLAATSEHLRCEWDPAYDPPGSLRFFLSLPLRQSSLKLRRSLFYVHRRDPNIGINNFDLTTLFESLANVTWSTFYASANCSIICRLSQGLFSKGLFSAFTSAIVKIG
ncbi:hypothetical protein ES708_27683 [subsurface metagenome]